MKTPVSPTVTRYAITIKSGEHRILLAANQGRDHYSSIQDAEAYLVALKSQDGNDYRIDSMFGTGSFDTLRVDPISCYPNGDAIGTILPEKAEA